MYRTLFALTLLAPISPLPAAAESCEPHGFTESILETEPGIELFVREGGRGEPSVVVPGDFLLFDRLCSLAETHRMIFYDMRNRGRSSPVEDGDRLTLEADVRDLEAIRRHFGLDRAALIGYSYLGKMVVRYALDHPGAVSRIVQLGAVPMEPERTFPPALVEPSLTASGAFDDEISELRARRAEGLHDSDPEAYCELEWQISSRGLFGDPENAPSTPSRCHLPNEWPTRLAFHMRHHFQASMLHSVITPIQVATLRVPVLTIHGTRDRNAPYGAGREWAASLPGSRLLTMDGMGHAIHRETDLVPILEVFFSGEWPDGVEAVEGAADGQRSQLQAWDLVRSALAHHAPDGIPEERGLHIEWKGTSRPRSQSRTAEPPFEPPFPLRWETTIASDLQRMALSEELQWPSFLSRYRSVVTPDDAFDLNLDTGVASSPFRDPEDLLARTIRHGPPLLLAEILEEHPGSLGYVGVVELDEAPVHALSAVHRGERIDLYLAEDGTLAAWGRIVSEPMLGDAYETIRLSGAVETAGLVLPARITRSLEGIGVTLDLELVSASWGDLDPSPFERPSPDPAADDVAASAPPRDEPPAAITALGDGIFLAPVPHAPDYQSMVVERDDHLVLLEAPVGEEATRRLLNAVAARFGDKPIRWVVATHHHFDHSGGVPAALESGATLVTTPGNVGFFRRAVTGPRTLEGRERAGAPTIHAVADRWAIPGGPPAVEVLRVEPNEHAAEMLAIYLSEAKLLFQGDLVRFPLPDDEPLRPQVAALWRLVESRDLDVERIAGVHGEVGTLENLEERFSDDPGDLAAAGGAPPHP